MGSRWFQQCLFRYRTSPHFSPNRCYSGHFPQILNEATYNIIGDALLFNTIPYDPGPLESISHLAATHLKSNGVSSVHFGGLIHANPYVPGPIDSPSLTTVSYSHVFQFSIPMCYIVSPIFSVGVFFWI